MRIFKAVFLTGVFLAMAACADGKALDFAALGPKADSAAPSPKPARTKVRKTEVLVAGGKVKLAAPSGFCISDKGLRRGAKSSFAFLARCDTLGQSSWSGGAPLAVITAAVSPQAEGDAAPSAKALARMLAPAETSNASDGKHLSLVRATGAAPAIKGLSRTHWRGAFEVNDHLVVLALYAAESSVALDQEGSEILRAMARGTKIASAGLNNDRPAPKRGGLLSRLVE